MENLLRALPFIEQNIEEDLDGERLSDIAGLSRFHFHRQFSKTFGVGVRSYIELLRLRRAAFRLAFRPRAFKRTTGQTPSQFRRAPRWEEWTLRTTAQWLTIDWLDATDHAPRNDALVFQRIAFFPDVAEREAITDVLLPLR